jgi:hypothetical protein
MYFTTGRGREGMGPLATVDFLWGDEDGFDLHLLRDSSSADLIDGLFVSDGGPNLIPAAGPGLPPDFLGVSFSSDVVPAKLVEQGITIDANGRINLAGISPPAPILRNFLVHARATHTNPALPSPLEADIRVHVHESVKQIWFTPAELTVHVGADGLKFTLLAEFNDGVGGDITDWTNLSWSSTAPGDVDVGPVSGELRALTAGANPTIAVTLPPTVLTPVMGASGVVHARPAWAAQDVEFVAGKGAAARSGVKNILFIADGFDATEKTAFDELVKNLVHRLRTGMRPYDLLRNSVNYWQTFVPSPKKGVSILPEVRTFTRDGKKRASVIPLAVKPGAAATSWQLEELIYRVGLPVLIDDPPTRPLEGAHGKLPDWQKLYGAGITRDLVQDHYSDWLAAATRTLLNEWDTAFGLGVGMRPNLRPENTTRNLELSPRRTTPDQFTSFVAKLTFGGSTVGTMWTTGDSKGLVCLIPRTLQDGGERFGVGFATALDQLEECEVATPLLPRLGLDVPAEDIGATNGTVLASTAAHECAHALGLLDEYGSGGSRHYPIPKDDALKTVGNLEPVRALGGAGALDGTKIKWLWPRISHAGVLAALPHPEGGGVFRLTLQPGHGAPFKTGDTARLRLRPLPEHPELSTVLRVTDVQHGDEILVRPDAAPAFVPGHWLAGSVLLVPVPAPAGPPGSFLPLVAPQVRDHVTATHRPLNGPPPLPQSMCGGHDNFIQVPVNLPAGLKPPKTKAFIVGVYEGGAEYDLDVFHPAGMCKMRSESTRCLGLTRFCQVCRYLIVDVADPSKHGDLDAFYEPEYPR